MPEDYVGPICVPISLLDTDLPEIYPTQRIRDILPRSSDDFPAKLFELFVVPLKRSYNLPEE